MTDQLREQIAAYDEWEKISPEEVGNLEVDAILDAARWKLGFPTDAQVEAAAARTCGEGYDDNGEFRSCSRCLTTMRAALEAAHNTEGPTS